MAGRRNGFVPGDPRINRKGRPKVGETLAEKIRNALNESDSDDGYTKLDELIDLAIQKARQGNFVWAEHLLSRAYGKVPDRIDFKKEEEFDLSKLSDEDIAALAAIRKKLNDQNSDTD